MNMGKIIGYTGGMCASKTGAMLADFERANYAKKKVLCLKPESDNRYGASIVKSRTSDLEFPAMSIPVKGKKRDIIKILKYVKENDIDIIGIDETQLFGKWIVNLAIALRNAKKKVIFNGLDMTFKGRPFGCIGDMLAIADDVVKFHAVCVCCGKDASFSQRLINGKPAEDGEDIVIENSDNVVTYEARCHDCFVPPKK